MKKKGRVRGTIGWLLAVIVCLGVVGYGIYTRVNTYIGASTGSGIMARFVEANREEGVNNTNALIGDVDAGFVATPTDATYKSYTLSYKLVGDDPSTKQYISAEGAVYVTEEYVYEKVKYERITNGVVERESVIAYHVKETGATWVCTNVAFTQNFNDGMMLDQAEWTQQATMIFAEPAFSVFTYVVGKAMSFNLVTGEYSYEETVGDVTESYAYTLGYTPMMYYDNVNATTKEASSCVVQLSNLNNTKVTLPKSLTAAMEVV